MVIARLMWNLTDDDREHTARSRGANQKQAVLVAVEEYQAAARDLLHLRRKNTMLANMFNVPIIPVETYGRSRIAHDFILSARELRMNDLDRVRLVR